MTVLETNEASVRSAASVEVEGPEPPYWGARELPVAMDEIYRHLDTHVLFKLHWGGRGVKGEAWEELLRGDFQPRLERMWREQDYLHPRALLGYFPCNADGNELIVWSPEAPGEIELERLVFPRQPRHDRICLADFYRPLDPGHPEHVDVVALQAVTAGVLRSVRNDAVALAKRRVRNFSHAAVPQSPSDDRQVLQVVGEIAANAFAAEAIVLVAAERLQAAYDSVVDGAPTAAAAEAASAYGDQGLTNVVARATRVLCLAR